REGTRGIFGCGVHSRASLVAFGAASASAVRTLASWITMEVAAAGSTEAAGPIRFSYRVEYLVFRAARAFFAGLSLPLALRGGAWLGELFYALDARDRRVALQNLRRAFPERSEAERRAILRASCRNLGRVAAEFCHLAELDAQTLPRVVGFADRAAWEAVIAQAQQSGAVILTAHFGNWELLAYAHGLLGHPITLVHRPMHNPLFDAAISAMRTASGTCVIRKKAAAKEALRALKHGRILAIP